ncbi:MAG: histone deacetylase [Actinomycetota bacterium]
MALAHYYSHPSSHDHDTGNHPECIERLVAIESELQRRDWLGYERIDAPPATREALLAVHSSEHVDRIHDIGKSGGAVDQDTVMSQGSLAAALHAAGGGVALVDALLSGDARAGFVGARPPGHHADRDHAMGFCLFNNVAVAARHALDAHLLKRVLILDWDVHHGNGTNDIFASSKEVLFISIHQSPLYPGSGPADDVGSGAGAGYTVNVPVAEGSGDEIFVSHVEHLVGSIARQYRPQLILVSAGYDAHRDDPLASCAVTEGGYAAMTTAVRRIATEIEAPIGMFLEGGYDLDALTRSVVATLECLAVEHEESMQALSKLHPSTANAAAALTQWWPRLAELPVP